jgi:asparagine synthase (glutamine-hydrolysing)
MCGIAGQFFYRDHQPVDRAVIEGMAGTIRHRGPDDQGCFIDGDLGLGFRRLSIIDLAGGHQPMTDAEESVWVVFNGEIYNYPELRSDLQAKGHNFRTRSDTEVIVNGYKEWGNDVFKHLNGMFGVAIWDVRRRKLLLARDAMGIKLVYYSDRDGCLAFGSEIRPVLAAGGADQGVSPTALHLFLRFRYVPSPLTMFSGVRKLAPGCMLVVEDGVCREERWYDFTPVPFDRMPGDQEALEQLLDLYRAAVRRHLLSDVPVGILLSGGLDSGLLLALMKENGSEWPAYTVGYGEAFEDDELVDASESARLLGGKFVPVRLDRNEYEKAFPGIVAALEEPVTSSSVVPMYFVCKRAREDVKVVIVGQGPDELFAGYTRHLGVRYGNLWRSVPLPLRQALAYAIQRMPRGEALKRGISSLGEPDRLERYHQVFSLAPPAVIDSLFREGRLPSSETHRRVGYWEQLLPQMRQLDELAGFQFLEVRSSLPDELLMFGDKLSMAHGIEARVPYLDRTVVEYAQRLGASFMIRGTERKWLHRRVCEKFLPPAILRRKKRGFAVNVVDGWFHSSVESGLSDLLRDGESLMYRMLDRDAVGGLLTAHRSGREDYHKLLFSLAMFEQWLRGIERSQPHAANALN